MTIAEDWAEKIAAKVSRVYCFPGGTIAPLLDALKDKVRLIVPRHEQGAGYAAIAEAKLTGRTQVVMVTSGPGVTNVATCIADCWYDSVPVVFICGQVGVKKGDRPIRQFGFQELPTAEMLAPISKFCCEVVHPHLAPLILDLAFNSCQSFRRGPAVLDVPMPLQLMEC